MPFYMSLFQQRALAYGIVTAGNGLGVAVLSPIISYLNDMFGWRITLRIAGSASVLIM